MAKKKKETETAKTSKSKKENDVIVEETNPSADGKVEETTTEETVVEEAAVEEKSLIIATVQTILGERYLIEDKNGWSPEDLQLTNLELDNDKKYKFTNIKPQ